MKYILLFFKVLLLYRKRANGDEADMEKYRPIADTVSRTYKKMIYKYRPRGMPDVARLSYIGHATRKGRNLLVKKTLFPLDSSTQLTGNRRKLRKSGIKLGNAKTRSLNTQTSNVTQLVSAPAKMTNPNRRSMARKKKKKLPQDNSIKLKKKTSHSNETRHMSDSMEQRRTRSQIPEVKSNIVGNSSSRSLIYRYRHLPPSVFGRTNIHDVSVPGLLPADQTRNSVNNQITEKPLPVLFFQKTDSENKNNLDQKSQNDLSNNGNVNIGEYPKKDDIPEKTTDDYIKSVLNILSGTGKKTLMDSPGDAQNAYFMKPNPKNTSAFDWGDLPHRPDNDMKEMEMRGMIKGANKIPASKGASLLTQSVSLPNNNVDKKQDTSRILDRENGNSMSILTEKIIKDKKSRDGIEKFFMTHSFSNGKVHFLAHSDNGKVKLDRLLTVLGNTTDDYILQPVNDSGDFPSKNDKPTNERKKIQNNTTNQPLTKGSLKSSSSSNSSKTLNSSSHVNDSKQNPSINKTIGRNSSTSNITSRLKSNGSQSNETNLKVILTAPGNMTNNADGKTRKQPLSNKKVVFSTTLLDAVTTGVLGNHEKTKLFLRNCVKDMRGGVTVEPICSLSPIKDKEFEDAINSSQPNGNKIKMINSKLIERLRKGSTSKRNITIVANDGNNNNSVIINEIDLKQKIKEFEKNESMNCSTNVNKDGSIHCSNAQKNMSFPVEDFIKGNKKYTRDGNDGKNITESENLHPNSSTPIEAKGKEDFQTEGKTDTTLASHKVDVQKNLPAPIEAKGKEDFQTEGKPDTTLTNHKVDVQKNLPGMMKESNKHNPDGHDGKNITDNDKGKNKTLAHSAVPIEAKGKENFQNEGKTDTSLGGHKIDVPFEIVNPKNKSETRFNRKDENQNAGNVKPTMPMVTKSKNRFGVARANGTVPMVTNVYAKTGKMPTVHIPAKESFTPRVPTIKLSNPPPPEKKISPKLAAKLKIDSEANGAMNKVNSKNASKTIPGLDKSNSRKNETNIGQNKGQKNFSVDDDINDAKINEIFSDADIAAEENHNEKEKPALVKNGDENSGAEGKGVGIKEPGKNVETNGGTGKGNDISSGNKTKEMGLKESEKNSETSDNEGKEIGAKDGAKGLEKNVQFEDNENTRYSTYGENGNVNGGEYVFVDDMKDMKDMKDIKDIKEIKAIKDIKGYEDIDKDCRVDDVSKGPRPNEKCPGRRNKKILDSLNNPSPSRKPTKKVTRPTRRSTRRRSTSMRTTAVQRPWQQRVPKDYCTNKHTGTYPNMMDCTKYWICAGGTTYASQCPTGLVYNFRIYACDTRSSIPMVVEDYFWLTCDSKRGKIPYYKSARQFLAERGSMGMKFTNKSVLPDVRQLRPGSRLNYIKQNDGPNLML